MPPLLFLLLLASASAIDNGLAARPGLGWNSDYCIGCAGSAAAPPLLGGFQNEAYVRQIADFVKSSGLAALGYVNINMDASWDLPTRDANGDLQPDPKLWPSGLASTVAYVHGLGLKFGLYGDRGTQDCAKNPGQLGHEAQDAAFFASLEIDWFKSDSCYAAGDAPTAFAQYAKMRDALNATGRPIWFALCGWEPMYAPVGATLGNSWRIGEDTGGGWANVMSNVEAMLTLGQYAAPGGWNDMSLMLLPGMGSGANLISPERHRAQFSLHCIFAANMLLTGNLSAAPQYVMDTWGNAEAVDVNQDPVYVPYLVLPHTVSADAGAVVGAQSGAYVQARLAECGGEPSLQVWSFSHPGFPPAFLYNAAADTCLNVEACDSTIIYDGCTTKGGTCSGPNSFLNEQWTLTAAGALASQLEPTNSRCATVAANDTLSLSPCLSPPGPTQAFSYNSATGQLQGANGLCLTAPSAPPAPGSNVTTLLVSRKLHDGTWALLALNNLPSNATITCGPACFAAMGLAASDTLDFRDLFLHRVVNTTRATAYDIAVGANGSSTFLRLSLAQPRRSSA